jgi:uncharacterized protein YbgA (DUF1722 family)
MSYSKHLKTIMIHKWHVYQACAKCGLHWRGIVHDLSKLSPTEFLELGKYYKEGTSPVNISRAKNGVSKAWLHHMGHNQHHWQYWVDFLPDLNRGVAMPMDDEAIIELICDWVGAGKAYEKEKWTEARLMEYWQKNNQDFLLHNDTVFKIFGQIITIEAIGFDEWAKRTKKYGI